VEAIVVKVPAPVDESAVCEAADPLKVVRVPPPTAEGAEMNGALFAAAMNWEIVSLAGGLTTPTIPSWQCPLNEQ